jgi:hypothetical protein
MSASLYVDLNSFLSVMYCTVHNIYAYCYFKWFLEAADVKTKLFVLPNHTSVVFCMEKKCGKS